MTVPVLCQFKDSLISLCTGAGNERGSFVPLGNDDFRGCQYISLTTMGEKQRSRTYHGPPAPHSPPVLCAANVREGCQGLLERVKGQIHKATSAPEKRSSEIGKIFSSAYGQSGKDSVPLAHSDFIHPLHSVCIALCSLFNSHKDTLASMESRDLTSDKLVWWIGQPSTCNQFSCQLVTERLCFIPSDKLAILISGSTLYPYSCVSQSCGYCTSEWTKPEVLAQVSICGEVKGSPAEKMGSSE